MSDDKVVLYMHGGSANHGCEAIVNTTCKMLNKPIEVLTANIEEDKKYSLNDLCELVAEKNALANKMIHILLYVKKKLLRDEMCYMKYQLAPIRGKKRQSLCLMVGGDNYCYKSMILDMAMANSILTKQGSRTVLWGCSIEPQFMNDEIMIQDLKKYSLIIARESITYEALVNCGITKNVFCFPDPAFLLEPQNRPLPEYFEENNTVGINISPMIIENERADGSVLLNYEALIEFIITHTQMQVALIPHVVRNKHDDRKPMQKLLNLFADTKRIIMIEDCSCMELKGYISQCRFFVGARTHSTIAAYSSCVPTLVVGYSVKAKGIARDIFGTYEKYVIPVQQLEGKGQLVENFQWLLKNESNIRNKLKETMPVYIQKAKMSGDIINNME